MTPFDYIRDQDLLTKRLLAGENSEAIGSGIYENEESKQEIVDVTETSISNEVDAWIQKN